MSLARALPCGLAALILLALPAAARADAPIALDKWSRYHVNIVPYMLNPMPPKGQKVKWVPKVSLVFKVTSPESDDIVELQHYQGSKKWGPVQKCILQTSQMVKRRGAGGSDMGYSLVVPDCLMDEKLAISQAGKFSVKVSYKQTGEGKLHQDLAEYRYEVKTHNGQWPGKLPAVKHYHVDHDFRLGEAWLYQNADGQLGIWTWFKYDREGEQLVRQGRLRCFVGDKKMSFYDSPTARTAVEVDQYPSRDVNGKFFWGLWYWWTARVDGKTGAEWIKENPGQYRCTLTQAGDVSRELSFEVDAEGKVKPAPCQSLTDPNGVRTVEDEQLIKVELKKAPDLKFDRAALKKAGLYGRKWLAGCPL